MSNSKLNATYAAAEGAMPNSALELDSEFVQKAYPYWRMRIMYTAIFGYAVFYMVRMNFPIAMPILSQQYGYTNTELGLVVTYAAIVYGIGKFINGFISDKSNARYFMTIALVGSAAVNLSMGMGTSLTFLIVMWCINSWFQSMAWPAIARLLTHWYSPVELGTKWGIANSSHQIGGAIILVLGGWLAVNYGLDSVFYVPAVIALIASFVLFNRLRDTPHSMGLPSVEVYKGIIKTKQCEEDDHLPTKELIRRVMKNKLLWYVCFGNMFLYIVRMGMFNWAPKFLQELKGSPILTSAWQSAAFEIAGIAGGIIAGYVSDKVFEGRRGPVSVMYMVILVLSLFYFWQVPGDHPYLNACAMFAIGFLVYGPQVLVGVAAADFASKKAVGAAAGLTGTFGYLGAAISGAGVGYIADNWDWNGVIVFFIASAIMGVLCFSLTWRHRSEVLEAQRKKPEPVAV